MSLTWFGDVQQFLRQPARMPASWAKALVGLSVFVLLLAVGGFFLYDGWHRVAYVVAFVAMGLENLCLAGQRLLPDGRAKRVAAFAMSPLVVVMMVALGASLAYLYGFGS